MKKEHSPGRKLAGYLIITFLLYMITVTTKLDPVVAFAGIPFVTFLLMSLKEKTKDVIQVSVVTYLTYGPALIVGGWKAAMISYHIPIVFIFLRNIIKSKGEKRC